MQRELLYHIYKTKLTSIRRILRQLDDNLPDFHLLQLLNSQRESVDDLLIVRRGILCQLI